MTTYNGYRITAVRNLGNLWSGLGEEGIDLAASEVRYQQLLDSQIRDAFPGAEVSLTWQGASGPERGFQVLGPEGSDTRYGNEDLEERCLGIDQELWESGIWYVLEEGQDDAEEEEDTQS